mgnify:CR=1 FL=1
MFVRKINKDYFVCRKRGRNEIKRKSGRVKKSDIVYSWFLIKNAGPHYYGELNVRTIVFPKELVGKRVRLKVEVIKLDKNKKEKK